MINVHQGKKLRVLKSLESSRIMWALKGRGKVGMGKKFPDIIISTISLSVLTHSLIVEFHLLFI